MSAQYFGYDLSGEKKHEAQTRMGALESALYLSKFIFHNSIRTPTEIIASKGVTWLHLQPTKQYFDVIADLFLDESTNSLILEHLERNLVDNLNAVSGIQGIDLDYLIGPAKFKLLVERHSAIRPSILNYYRRVSTTPKVPLMEFIEQFENIDPRVKAELQFQQACEQIMNGVDLV